MGDEVEWSYTAATSRFLRALRDASLGLVGGAAAVAAVAVGAVVVRSAAEGDFAPLALLVLLLLVGGPFSLLYLAPMLADPSQRPRLVRARSPVAGLSRRRLVVASLAGAAVLGAAWFVDSSLPGAIVPDGALVLMACLAALTTTGSLDPADGTLTVDGRSVALADLQGVRSVALGGVVVAWLSYARGIAVGVPRLVAVPTAVWSDVEGVLREAARAEAQRDDPLTGQVRRSLVGFGVGLLALAVAFGSLATARSDAGPAFLPAVGLIALLAALFVWLGTT